MPFRLSCEIQRKKPGKLASLLRGLRSMGRGPDQVRVGFPAGATDSEMVAIATFNEFGTRGSGKPFKTVGKGGKLMGGFGGPIPERPFLRNAMRANRGKYQKAMSVAAREMLKHVADGGNFSDAKREVLRKLGVMAVVDIQAEIDAMQSPPNSPLTVAIKGSSKPLINTGEMRSKVSYKVD